MRIKFIHLNGCLKKVIKKEEIEEIGKIEMIGIIGIIEMIGIIDVIEETLGKAKKVTEKTYGILKMTKTMEIKEREKIELVILSIEVKVQSYEMKC